MKKASLSLIITIVVIVTAFVIGFSTSPDADKVSSKDSGFHFGHHDDSKDIHKPDKDDEDDVAPEFKKIDKVTDKMRNAYFGESAFIGSSIGVGQKAYFESKGAGFLGDPIMMVTGSYSFNNDKGSNPEYKISYNGVAMMAKDAVAQSKVKRVFIAMGTNDCFGDADYVYNEYVKYIEGIRELSPEVVIFIESTTGVTAAKQGTYLNSKTINGLNEKMEEYCKEHEDIYYVDVSSKMLDANGYLKSEYSSDNYVHLSTSAYEIWTNELIAYVDKLIIKETNAENAVKAAEDADSRAGAKEAQKLVDKLDDGTVKDKLNERINAILE